jgi:CheY-like chemotaxis protein/HPt (histidine-containing phosphotransfer) domain-containing protein
MTAAQQQHVFESFSQADTSIARQYGGTGLGLTICKQLVEMMDGKIWIESEKGRGSIFHFTVVVAPGEEESKSVELSLVSSKPENLDILLVEDNKINQDLARITLERDGHRITVADNGLEALNILGENDFDLILMDVQMPIMDGLTATAIIRKAELGKICSLLSNPPLEEKLIKRLNGRHRPIIAMTANAMSGDRKKCLDAGMDDYLTKPFIPEYIYRALGRILPDAETHTKKQDKLELSLKEQAQRHLKQFYSLDDKMVEGLLLSAQQNISTTLAAMITAGEENNSDDLRKTAHSLKGVLLNLGLDNLAQQAKEIEQVVAAEKEYEPQLITEFIKSNKELLKQ